MLALNWAYNSIKQDQYVYEHLMLIVLTICNLSEPLIFFSCEDLLFVEAIFHILELILGNILHINKKLALILRKIYLALKIILFYSQPPTKP